MISEEVSDNPGRGALYFLKKLRHLPSAYSIILRRNPLSTDSKNRVAEPHQVAQNGEFRYTAIAIR